MHAELLCPSPVSGQPPPILQPLSCNLQLASCIVHGPSSTVRPQPSIFHSSILGLFLEKAKFKKTNPNQILTPAYLILEKVNSNNKSEQILLPPYMSIFR